MTFVANPKAGMDSIEFSKYIFSTIFPLYPDAEDIAGKRVAIIVDSGPGRVNSSMLAKLRIRGFYLIPGVPNTTHVTQATDRNYSMFKSVYRNNLGKLTDYITSGNNEKKTIQPTDIPLLIFGGGPQEIDLQDAFELSFGYDQNTKIWAEIGLNPFNRNCLNDNKVKHEIVTRDGVIDVDADPLAKKLLDIEVLNHQAVLLLNANGYNGDALLTHAS